MFIPDTPIPSLDKDSLNRAKFAEQLAQTILKWEKPESMVIALFGPWGSGKTSVMNMVVDHIGQQYAQQNENEKPILLKFNPWFFSGQNELLTIFFAQLLSVIERTGAKNARILRQQLTKYSGLASVAAKAIPVVGGVAGTVIEEVAKTLGPSQNFNTLRADIDKTFKELGKQVIILIDDVDRLSQDEIRQMFRLIKLNADFPNTIYIIAADRNVLVKSLESEQGISGQAYLEKIVQVGFDVPIVEPLFIENILTRAMDETLGPTEPHLWDQDRWARLYHKGFKRLFTTIRVVKRYVNSLAFNYQMVIGEVNPIDFIGIEAVRVFAPEVYTGISNNRAVFCSGDLGTDTPSQPSFFAKQLNDQELRQYCDDIFKLAIDGNQKSIREICLELFPAIRRAYPGTDDTYERPEEHSRMRRICSPDMFAYYFVLGLPQGEVSRAELLDLRKTLNEGSLDATIELLTAYIDDHRIRRLLELFEDVDGELSEAGATNFATALIRIGESVPKDAGRFVASTDWLIKRGVWRTLKKLTPQAQRAWFTARMAEPWGTYYLTTLVSWQRNEGEGPLTHDAIFDEQMALDFQAMCVERIRAMAAAGTLLTTKNPNYLLLRWRKWTADPAQVSAFIATQLTGLSSTLEFLKLYLAMLYIGGGQSENRILVQDIERLIDLAQIDVTLTALRGQEERNLPDELQTVLEAWDRSYQPPAQNNEEK